MARKAVGREGRPADGKLSLEGHTHPRAASGRPSWRDTAGPRGSMISHCSSRSSSEPCLGLGLGLGVGLGLGLGLGLA